MKKKLFFLYLIMATKIALSQNFNIDTVKILYCAKLQTLESEGAFYNSKSIKDYLDNELSVKFLKSKSFTNISFILIEQRNGLTDTINSNHTSQTFKQNQVYWNCDYIVAYSYSTKLYYKLKGFRNNDFLEFIHHMQIYSATPLPKYTIEDKETFLFYYYVEDLDLGCLWEYYFGKRKKKKKYPCVQSCVERDLTIENPH